MNGGVGVQIAAFLVLIFGTLALAAFIGWRQEKAAERARHRCRHIPTIGAVHVRTVTPGTDPYVELKLAEFGTKDRSPVYDLDMGLQAGESV